MYTLLNSLQYQEVPRVKPPGTDFLKQGLLNNIKVLKEQYNTQRTWSSNEHIIVKLLTGMPLDLNTPSQRFYDMARSINNQQVVKHQLCNPVNTGVIRIGNGSFYDKQITEQYLCIEESLEVESIKKNWRNFEPVRVLSHPYDDLTMALPDGNYPFKVSNNYALFVFNLPLLFLMYREWYHEIGSKIPDFRLRPHSFVRNYLLPTIAPSHIDIARFNRLYRTVVHKPLTPFKASHSFFINDYSQRTDEDFKWLIDFFNKTPLTYNQLLACIPSISRDSFANVLKIPNTLINRQNQMALFMSRIKVIQMLLTINKDNNDQLNISYLTEVRILLREMHNDSITLMNYPQPIIDIYEDLKKALL